MCTVSSFVADSSRTPSGSSSGPRRMTPPAGSGVDRSMPAMASAARLARSAWWSCAHSATGRPGATRSRSAAVGQPPPAVRVPAVALEPGRGVRDRFVSAPDPGEAVVDRRGIREIDMAGRDGRPFAGAPSKFMKPLTPTRLNQSRSFSMFAFSFIHATARLRFRARRETGSGHQVVSGLGAGELCIAPRSP